MVGELKIAGMDREDGELVLAALLHAFHEDGSHANATKCVTLIKR
jgi:hypothetical protein